MTDMAAANIKGVGDWEQLVEIGMTCPIDDDRQIIEPLMDSLKGLNLQLGQLERLRQAFGQAFAKAERCGGMPVDCQLRLRIWVLGDCASSRGWGFFLVDRGSDPHGAPPDSEHLVELFLYQERDR